VPAKVYRKRLARIEQTGEALVSGIARGEDRAFKQDPIPGAQ